MELNVSTCFAVEDRHKIIGVAVRCLGSFRVFSSVTAYRIPEDEISPNARAVDRSVAKLGAFA
jgi:hypothetical protein